MRKEIDARQGAGPIHVLVVDDSAVVREVLTQILGKERDMSVAVAADPIIARDKIARKRPDVLVLDLELPRMDGLTFLRELMGVDDPIPVVICSSLGGLGAEMAMRALDDGAVDVVEKPKMGVRDFLAAPTTGIADVVRGAAHARPRRRTYGADVKRPSMKVPGGDVSPLKHTTDKVVAVGASTGGTEALRVILEELPPDSPGLVVVQHMPAIFTSQFAQRLDKSCRIAVKEASPGDRVIDGRALIAPGDRHLEVRRSGAHYIVDLSDAAPVCHHRPSVDVLFHSVARCAGPNAIGVLLTGMGADGAEGLLAMRRSGAWTIAQDEKSSVVFGMPKEAIERGAAAEVVSLSLIARRVLVASKSASGP